MCRHLAYVGAPRTVASLLTEPPYGLVRQSYAPRRQQHGRLNADGYGLGWYPPAPGAVPLRHRWAQPIWSDPSVTDLASGLTSTAVLAAVRNATEGMPFGIGANAPFAIGSWLVSHNGKLAGWPATGAVLAADLPLTEVLTLPALTDSALLSALLDQYRTDGATPADGVRELVVRAATVSPGSRLNLLVTDGTTIVATAYGDTLCWRATDDGVVVASEPYDDEPGWYDVADGCLVAARPGRVEISALQLPAAHVTR
jgi:glutamine amidotransferase